MTALLGSPFAPVSHALGGPKPKIAGDSRPDPIWTAHSAIGVDLNANGTVKAGETGRMTAPQNQTQTPATPAVVQVALGETVAVSIEAATDYDHWETPWQAGTGPNPKTYDNDFGDAIDSVTYSWAGVGSLTNASSSATTWTAPTTLGNYTLTCTIDDSNTVDRNDPAITRTVAVHVVPPKNWTVGSAVGTNLVNGVEAADGRLTLPQNQTGTPTPAKVAIAPGATINPTIETAHDWDHWERDLNANGTVEADEKGDEADTVSYKWTASGGTLTDSTKETAKWVAPLVPGRYTLTCTIDDAPAAVNAPNTGTRNDAAVVRTVIVDVWKAELKVKRADEGDDKYADTTTIAGGGKPSDVHKAKVQVFVSDADGAGVGGITVNAASVNGGGFVNGTLAFGATATDGKATADLSSGRIIEDTVTIKVPYDAASATSAGPSTSVVQTWGSSAWTLPEYFDYNTPADIAFTMTMDDEVGIGGHGITFEPWKLSGYEWNVFVGEDWDEDGVPDGDYVPATYSDENANLTGWNLRKTLASFAPQPPTGTDGNIYNSKLTVSWDDDYIIDYVGFIAWDDNVDNFDGVEIRE